MKTIREWFNELPEPFRTQALQASTERRLGYPAGSMANAIDEGFAWTITQQGGNYWSAIHNKCWAIEDEQRRFKHESTPLE